MGLFIADVRKANEALEASESEILELKAELRAARSVITHQQITCTEQLEEIRRLAGVIGEVFLEVAVRAAVAKCEEDP